MSPNEIRTIGEMTEMGALEFGDGYRTKRSEHGAAGFRIIRVADVSDGIIQLHGPDFVSSDFAHAIGGKAGRPGDVLLTTKGTVGRVAIVPDIGERIVYSPQLCYFRVIDAEVIDPRYLSFWFSSEDFLYQASHRMNNTDMAAYINLADIRSLAVRLPTISEQRAIADVLGSLNSKIDTNNNIQQSALALGAAIFQRALLATGLREVPLSDVARNIAGRYLAKEDYASDGPYFVYGSNSVMGRHDKALVPSSFAVLAKIGSYCGNLRWSDRPAWVNNNASAIVPKKSISPWVLRHALDLVDMAPHRAGTGQPYIRMESLFASLVRVPSPAVSASIAPLLQSLSELEVLAAEENSSLAGTRNAILPMLVSGKLRVRDAEKVLEGVL
jgi:type I restriction enzyme S subunit